MEANICFGLEFSEERFDRVVKAACLDKDMEAFANGKLTMIGERGVNVSGGQKARISLARALYQNADIYLLDDPLSAVDPKIATKIFERAILEELKDKCVVLVTHQIQFLERCPQILILEDGKQKMLGNYRFLIENGFDAREILQSYTQTLKK